MDTDAERVAAAVLQWFAASAVAQKKHTKAEWTVLAGVVLRRRRVASPSEVAEFRVLAGATGTKCLGRRDLDADGLVVNDAHAEVVARRAFLRYLYSEAQQWATDVRAAAADESIFEKPDGSDKLRLKPGHELHLFISEAPCGDAAIYPLKESVVDALVEQRTQRERVETPRIDDDGDAAAVERSELRLTGAKLKRPREGDVKDMAEKRFEQLVGIARVKSGRSDLPADKQTLSMSCSDKIAKWTVEGVQGTLLLRWFEPLFLSSVVVSEDPACQSRAAQLRAMERALRDRVQAAVAADVDDDRPPVALAVHASATRFDRQRDASKTPSPLSLNWTRQEKHWADADTAAAAVEVLIGATGFKEGAKKASKMDAKTKQRVASRLSKWRLARAYGAVRSHHQPNGQACPPRAYDEEKAVVLQAASTTERKDLAQRRERLQRALGAWVGVPSSFKSFPMPPHA